MYEGHPTDSMFNMSAIWQINNQNNCFSFSLFNYNDLPNKANVCFPKCQGEINLYLTYEACSLFLHILNIHFGVGNLSLAQSQKVATQQTVETQQD